MAERGIVSDSYLREAASNKKEYIISRLCDEDPKTMLKLMKKCMIWQLLPNAILFLLLIIVWLIYSDGSAFFTSKPFLGLLISMAQADASISVIVCAAQESFNYYEKGKEFRSRSVPKEICNAAALTFLLLFFIGLVQSLLLLHLFDLAGFVYTLPDTIGLLSMVMLVIIQSYFTSLYSIKISGYINGS